MIDLGKILKAIRLSKGISQDEMAYELEMSLSTYSKIERGLADMGISKLEKLSKFTGLSLVDIITYGTEGSNEANNCKKMLEEKDREIMRLQKDLIEALKKKY